MRRVTLVLLGYLLSCTGAVPAQKYVAHNRTLDSCPDYNEYSQKPHGPYSEGPLALPYMRPAPECRTFNSSAVEVSPDELIRVMHAESGKLESYR